MLRTFALLALTLFTLACSHHDRMLGPEEIDTPSGPATKLSYVAKPSANGTRCMYDQPGLLYWSRLGITATVLNKGRWEYYTYSWEHIGVSPEEGRTSYGINNGRITFPGDHLAVWDHTDSL